MPLPIPVLLLLACSALLLVAPGCSEDDPGPAGPDESTIRPPTNPVTLLRTVYEEMNPSDLDEVLLHKDFRMILLPETQQQWSWSIGTHFDRATFVDIHRNLFGGKQGVDPLGDAVHSIGSIEVDLLEQQLAWVEIPAGEPNFGGIEGEYARFRITMQFHNVDLSHRLLVQQLVDIYVAPVTLNGYDGYQLLGLRGVSLKERATDQVAWDGLCSLFLNTPDAAEPEKRSAP